ncbi:SEC23-interacting protein [Lates japonicus]
MADRKNNNVPNTGANLLFSAAPEFSFNLPFMPVSQATGPAVLSGDDSTDVGEEDSFLGQTSGNGPAPSTFNYFSSPVTTSDPFASIGQSPCPPPTLSAAPTTTGLVSAPSSVSMAPPPPPPTTGSHMNPAPPPAFGGALYHSPMGRHTPPPASMTPPPPQMQPQSHNPYRHTPTSSRASPYIPAPEILPPTHTPQQNPYSLSSPPQAFPPSGPTFTRPPPTQIQAPPPPATTAGAIVPAGPMIPYNYNVYEPVQPHWFYCKQVESRSVWLPFSIIDSLQLEETYNSVQPDPENVIVRTDGGRYDVQLYDRMRTAVYWEEEPTEVRRCSWFYKGDTDSRFIPYSEEFSDKLEAEYKKAVSTNQWHRRLEFPSGETIVMHNPKVIVQFQPSSMPDEWGTTQDGQTRPRVVKRGIDDDLDEVPDGELAKVDHLVFMVHGIGPVCDLRFRSMVECVDDFRNVSLKLLHSHFNKPLDENAISRVEFLPVQWHTALHGDATGVDRRIKKITLPSTGRLRHFTNETLLDVLFYNSPTYCQTIMDTVALEINRLYALFLKRNPDYKGGISVAGHSLGSLILFDLLSNQKNGSPPFSMPVMPTSNGDTKQVAAPVTQSSNTITPPPPVEEEAKEDGEEFEDLSAMLEHLGLSEYKSTFDEEKIDVESFLMCTIEDLKEMGIPLGPRKKIAKFVKERVSKQAARQAAQEKKAEAKEVSQVAAPPSVAEALPDPAVKKLPTGNTVSSIHVNYNYFEVGTGQVSVVYHALDFEPVNFFALGSPIGMFLTVRGLEKIEETYQLPTCKGFFNIYHPLDPVAYRIEPMIIPDLDLKPVLIPHHKGRKRLHLELKESLSRMGSDLKQGFISSLRSAWQTLNEFARAHTSSAQLQAELAIVANQIEEQEKQAEEEHKIPESPEPQKDEEPQVKIGMLNGGNRIDYVLQEKPIESFNEYLFALQSHLCYWQSEDTALLILKEIYHTMGIHPEQIAH